MVKVLFVCTANICRSPMAQAIFAAVTDDRSMSYLATSSAGTAALEGKPMSANATSALEEIGVYPGPHRARQVTAAMLEDAELVLAMTPYQAATVGRLGRRVSLGIHVLPEYATGIGGEGVPDPYGHTMVAYRSTVRQLYEYVELVADRLTR